MVKFLETYLWINLGQNFKFLYKSENPVYIFKQQSNFFDLS